MDETGDARGLATVKWTVIGEPLEFGRLRSSDLAVLHVLTSTHRRGAETYAFDLAYSLRHAGMRTDVVALASGAGPSQLPVPSLGTSRRDPRVVHRLRKRLRSADVAVAHGSTTLPVTAIATFPHRTPFVYRVIGDPAYWAASGARRQRVRLLLRRAQAIAVYHPAAAQTLRRLHGIAPERIAVIPKGLPLAHHPVVTPAERSAARQQLGIAPDQPTVAVIGALSPEKDPALALEVARRSPGTTTLVVGTGPDRASLEARYGSGPADIRFLGSVESTRSVLGAADVVLLTSRTEGVPGVLIEAGLAGIPVVTTDVGGVREVVVDGETGLVVGSRDASAIGEAIDQAIAGAATLGPAARRHCAAAFDLEPVTAQWVELLVRTARGRRG